MSGWHIDPIEQPDGTLKPVAAYGNEDPEDYDEDCELELAERMRDENA
jgi:hypothetical protein